MDEFGQIKSDISDVKNDVSKLSTDTAVIKTEVSDMKQSITTSVEKISTTMTQMAVMMERLNTNQAEHTSIRDRLDDVEDEQEAQTKLIESIRISHDACLERRKTAETKEQNSTWNKLKDKSVEYLFIGLVGLVLFILYTHLTDFLKFMSNKNEVQVKVQLEQQNKSLDSQQHTE